MSAAAAIATYELSKRYGYETALDRIDLRVPEGAIYALIGANGAGKSTTFRILMNLERADAGVAEVAGMDSVNCGPEVRALIGYVPERPDHLYRFLTCGALLGHAAAYYPAWDGAYADRLCRTFGLRPDRMIGSLSKGDGRRLQIVLALAHRPRVLLLDEPTDGLDPLVRSRTLSLLAEHLADTPTTILIATHQIHEFESLADHLGVLRRGRLALQIARDDLPQAVARYRVDVPPNWQVPHALRAAGVRPTNGREAQWTLIGNRRDLIDQLTLAGAFVHDVRPLGLEESALAFLSQEVAE
jgi:ABC-2 type transport system ATP-binding protein